MLAKTPNRTYLAARGTVGLMRGYEVDEVTGADTIFAYEDKEISSAQLLALNATPIQIVTAPGAGYFVALEDLVIHKPAGTAYGGIAAGEDLSVKYTGAAGLELAGCEATGFLDQATAQTRHVRAYRAASGVSDLVCVENAGLFLHMLVGEIITGTSVLRIRTWFRVLPFSFA